MRARDPQSKGADPVRVFLILAAFMTAIGAFLWLTRSDPIPESPANATAPTESPDFSLTDEEAIARFKELDELSQLIYRERDQSLIPEVYIDGSRIAETVRNEVRRMARDGVYSATRFKTLTVEVTINTPSLIRLEQVVVVTPRFMSDSGDEVTGKERAQKQTVKWALKLEGQKWQIESATITSSEQA